MSFNFTLRRIKLIQVCKSLVMLFFAAILTACSHTPQPEQIVEAYLMAISEGDSNAIYYTKYYSHKESLTLAEQEIIQSLILPARFMALKKGGLKDIVITDIETPQPNMAQVYYKLIFYKDNEIDKGVLTLEYSNDSWFIIN